MTSLVYGLCPRNVNPPPKVDYMLITTRQHAMTPSLFHFMTKTSTWQHAMANLWLNENKALMASSKRWWSFFHWQTPSSLTNSKLFNSSKTDSTGGSKLYLLNAWCTICTNLAPCQSNRMLFPQEQLEFILDETALLWLGKRVPYHMHCVNWCWKLLWHWKSLLLQLCPSNHPCSHPYNEVLPFMCAIDAILSADQFWISDYLVQWINK